MQAGVTAGQWAKRGNYTGPGNDSCGILKFEGEKRGSEHRKKEKKLFKKIFLKI